MADFTSVPTVELLTRAADAAGKAAEACGRIWPKPVTWAVILSDWPGLRALPAPLAASGPDHWRAVKAMLRAQVELHDRYWAAVTNTEHACRHGYIACCSLDALRPLAEQVLRDLGETP